MPPEPLSDLQRRIWRLITAREGVTAGLAELTDDPRAAPVSGWIAAADEDTARERLDIYANMYFFRLRDALQESLPKVAALLGPEVFHDVVTDYLLAHPSTRPSLRHLAAHLPGFLAGHPAGSERVDLAGLARLELCRNDAFDAPDSVAMPASALASIPGEEWPGLRFELVPAARWLTVAASTLPTWRALAEGREVPPADPATTGCVLWRAADLQVWHRAATLTEVAALDAVAEGAPFARVCEILATDADGSDPEALARPALTALGRWLGDGLIAARRRAA